MREYALYKGEEILSIGTLREVAKEMGVKRETIAHYKTPAYIKRRDPLNRNVRILIPLDEEEEHD